MRITYRNREEMFKRLTELKRPKSKSENSGVSRPAVCEIPRAFFAVRSEIEDETRILMVLLLSRGEMGIELGDGKSLN